MKNELNLRFISLGVSSKTPIKRFYVKPAFEAGRLVYDCIKLKVGSEGLIDCDSKLKDLKSLGDVANYITQVEVLLSDLLKINEGGYLNELKDLPLVSDMIEEYFNNNEEAIKKDAKVNAKAKSVSKTKVSLAKNKWCYNLLILLLYIQSTEIFDLYSEIESDEIIDLKTIISKLERKLDPTIARRLRKVGVTITQNIYVGFDTEYETSDLKKNKNELLSTQLVGNSRLIVKLPQEVPFKTEYLHPLTSEVITQETSSDTDLLKILSSIDYNISEFRKKKYGNYREFLNKLSSSCERIPDKKHFLDDDKSVFILPLTKMVELFNETQEYNLSRLVKDCEGLMQPTIEKNSNKIMSVINEPLEESQKLVDCLFTNAFSKRSSRLAIRYKGERVFITTRLNLFISCHLSSADLSMLSDFEDFKQDLTIVNKCFVTTGKGLIRDDCRFILHVRDTMLLAPGPSKSLKEIGKIYGGDFEKINLKGDIANMKALLKKDPDKFRDYAMRDSLITLKHLNTMEEFYFTLNKIGVPLTLTSISKSYIEKEWKRLNYKGYQLKNGYSFGKIPSLVSPRGINSTGAVGLALNHYIASYKGGRNESFMYGVERWVNSEGVKKVWCDYDLAGAYPTGMILLGDPDYSQIRILSNEVLKAMSFAEVLNSYTAIDVYFEFPDSVKYPSIACQVDETLSIYPLKGKSTITGLDYLLAKKQGCEINVLSGYTIPFKNYNENTKKDKYDLVNLFKGEFKIKRGHLSDALSDEEKDKLLQRLKPNWFDEDFNKFLKFNKTTKPFDVVVKELIAKRKEHPKKSFYNLMYKEITNSIYGLTAMGLAAKKKFDVKTKETKQLEGSDLSNPLVASYITSFVRVVVGECLQNLQELNGKVISVTTDGFITDIENLEDKLLALDLNRSIFFRIFLNLRRFVVNPSELSLELKNVEGAKVCSVDCGDERENGIISWTTRGQFGFTSGIKACTGFQTNKLDLDTLKEVLLDIFEGKNLTVSDYIQSTLRSSKDIFLKGGHVVVKYKDQSFKMAFDNKRKIVDVKNEDRKTTLLDSKPWETVGVCSDVRSLIKIVYNTEYNSMLTKPQGKGYKTHLETAVRTFIKSLFGGEGRYGVSINDFDCYNDLINFIRGFKPAKSISMSKSSISRLKSRKMVLRTVPATKENQDFVKYISSKLANFKPEGFFNISKKYEGEVLTYVMK